MSTADNNTHVIYDEGDLRKYRAEIPNMVFDMGLSPYELALYCHLKRTCGAEGGLCWKSVKTLAKETKMSTGRVSEARKHLHNRGLIVAEQPEGPGTSIFVTIVDIWQANFKHFATLHNMKAPSPHETTPSRREAPRSSGERKKEPFKKKPFKKEKESKEKEENPYDLRAYLEAKHERSNR